MKLCILFEEVVWCVRSGRSRTRESLDQLVPLRSNHKTLEYRTSDHQYANTGTIRDLCFSLKGKFLSACSSNCTVHIFDMRSHKKRQGNSTTTSIVPNSQHERCFARARLHSIPISCSFLVDTRRTRSTVHFFVITEHGRYVQYEFNRETGGECVRREKDRGVPLVVVHSETSEEGFVELS